MDKYQLVFSNFSNDSIIGHSDPFILTGETQPANAMQNSGGGLSAGDKAAIGVLVPVGVLAILALCCYLHRRSTRRRATQNALEKGDQPSHRAELDGSHRFTGFLHRFRPELSDGNEVQEEKDKTLVEMPDGTRHELPAGNNSPVEMPSPDQPGEPPSVREAASPVEMPSPDPIPNAGGGMRGVRNRSASPTTEEVSSAGDRPRTNASADNSGVGMMLAQAKNQHECLEFQTVESGFIVTRKPVGTCRKELPQRHMPADSTISTTSSTMVGSDEHSADLRHDQRLSDGTEILGSLPQSSNEVSEAAQIPQNWDGRGWEQSMVRSSFSESDANHESRLAREQSVNVSAKVENNVKQEHDPHVGNEAEDEMTKPPEGDIF